MLKLLGTYIIPEWAICYLINGDKECLTDKEIESANEFVNDVIKHNNAKHIDFDIEVMDEEKYGNAYRNEIDAYPAFGGSFGATTTWNIPVWADVETGDMTEYTMAITGKLYDHVSKRYKRHVVIVENMEFEDEFEAEVWIETYFKHFHNLDYSIVESEDFVLEHQQ